MTSVNGAEAISAYDDDGRSGVHQTSGLPESARVAWLAGTDSPVVAAPTLAGDTLLAATAGSSDADGALHAFDARTGAERWCHVYSDRSDEVTLSAVDEDWLVDVDDDVPGVIAAPVVWRNRVFVEEFRNSRWIYMHDLHSGEVVHTITRGGTPTLVGDLLLIHEVDAGARALRLPDLTELWRGVDGLFSDAWLRACPSPGPDGTAYAALGTGLGRCGGVIGFVPATGEVLFESTGTDDSMVSPVRPVFAEGLVWTVDDGGIAALDPRTGERRRSHASDARKRAASPAVAGDVVLFVARERPGPFGNGTSLRGIDSTSGEPRWTAPLTSTGSSPLQQTIGPPVVAGDTVYVSDASGTISAFGIGAGDTRWTVETGEPIASVFDDVLLTQPGDQVLDEDAQAVVPGEGVLYVRTEAGVVALR